MKQKVAVLADGIAAVSPEQATKLDIAVVPLHVIIADQDLLETEVSLPWLADQLNPAAALPGTAAFSIGEILHLYELAAERADSIVSVHVSSTFSKSYEAGLEARTLLLQKRPELKIEVVDSQTSDAAEFIVAEKAAVLALQGRDFDEVVRRTYEVRDGVCGLTCLETLYYRDRGGRIFRAKSWAEAENRGSTGFRTLLQLDHSTGGIVHPLSRARAKKQLLRKMAQVAAERCDGKSITAAIAHVAAEQEAECLAQMLQDHVKCNAVYISHASATSTVHNGRGFMSFGFRVED